MTNYDLLFLIPGSFSENEVPGLLEDVKGLLAEAGAEKIQMETMGRQKLAYPIKTNHFGYLINSCFALLPEKTQVLKEKLGLEPTMLRFTLTHHQAKTFPHRRVPGRIPTAPVPMPKATTEVDLKEIDKKIDEILQQDSFVV